MRILMLIQEWCDGAGRTRTAGEIIRVEDDTAERLITEGLAISRVRSDDPEEMETK